MHANASATVGQCCCLEWRSSDQVVFAMEVDLRLLGRPRSGLLRQQMIIPSRFWRLVALKWLSGKSPRRKTTWKRDCKHTSTSRPSFHQIQLLCKVLWCGCRKQHMLQLLSKMSCRQPFLWISFASMIEPSAFSPDHPLLNDRPPHLPPHAQAN